LKAHDIYTICLNCLLDGEITANRLPASAYFGALILLLLWCQTSGHLLLICMWHFWKVLLEWKTISFLTLPEISQNEGTSYRREGSNVFFFVPA